MGTCLCRAPYGGEGCADELWRDDLPPRFPGLADAPRLEAHRAGGEGSLVWRRLRVLMVTAEAEGPARCGGIGTAFTALAERLAANGHNVTVLFTPGEAAAQPSGAWGAHVKAYATRGVRLLGLPRRATPSSHPHIPRHLAESFEVLRFLLAAGRGVEGGAPGGGAEPGGAGGAYDVVHLHDYGGAGYYSLLAKSQGLGGLEGTAFVTGCHGPTMWAKARGNGEAVGDVAFLELDHMERRTVELADFVVSPSHSLLRWMAREGWALNAQTFVQPNVLPVGDRGRAVGGRRATPVRELVFFGRLETRKGLVIFCDALDRLLGVAGEGPGGAAAAAAGVRAGPGGLERVSFLGRSALVHGRLGEHYVRERARRWEGRGVAWGLETGWGSEDAKAYLEARGSGRLAVMPSLVENSPYAVLECAERGIPFVASNVGGTPDLVHPEDQPHALVAPGDVDALVARLAGGLAEGVRAARPRVEASVNENEWMQWHEWLGRDVARVRRAARRLHGRLGDADLPFMSVVVPHHERPGLLGATVGSLAALDYPADRFEVVLLDDGSQSPAALEALAALEAEEFAPRGWRVLRGGENCGVGCARNRGAAAARGDYLVFLDSDDLAAPGLLRRFAAAMETSGADLLTAFADLVREDGGALAGGPGDPLPGFVFLGGSADVGAFKNSFGGSLCCVRRASFEAFGGYTEDRGAGMEDWEMYARAALHGYRVDVVPESLYWHRLHPGALERSADFAAGRWRALRPYLDRMPPALRAELLAQALPPGPGGRPGPPRGLAAQGGARWPGLADPQAVPLR